MCDKSRNTWLCVHWQWNTLEWCQLNALQASPVMHLVTPLSCVSLSMNTQPSVPAISTVLALTQLGIRQSDWWRTGIRSTNLHIVVECRNWPVMRVPQFITLRRNEIFPFGDMIMCLCFVRRSASNQFLCYNQVYCLTAVTLLCNITHQ